MSREPWSKVSQRWSRCSMRSWSSFPCYRSALVVLGFPDIVAAADAVPAVLPHQPIALEGVDHRLIHDEQIKRLNPKALEELPAGKGFLMVQFGGDTREDVDAAAHRMLDLSLESEHDPNVAVLDDPTIEDELWQVREAGLGATAHVPGHRDTFEGWEDSAVAPERLGAYLRDLESCTRVWVRRRDCTQPLRPLRSGLRAHPHPVRSVFSRRRRHVPAVHGTRGRSRSHSWRIPLRRAWRRAVPRRAPTADVRRRDRAGVRRTQGDLRSARPAESRQDHRPIPPRREPASRGIVVTA